MIFHQCEGNDFVKEAGHLLSGRYGCVILDEAHKARVSGGLGKKAGTPNNLLLFMRQIAKKTRHLILGTATPIQTDVSELWSLLSILNSGAEFVLGDSMSPWIDKDRAIPMITGKESPQTEEEAWHWLQNPLPPAKESMIFHNIREDLGLRDDQFYSAHRYEELGYFTQSQYLASALEEGFLKEHNPLLRHIVLRKRSELEDARLLDRVGVTTHPQKNRNDLYESRFISLGITTNTPFEVAYRKAEEFCQLLNKRTEGSAGFMKSLMLQRICSSFESGRKTAQRMIQKSLPDDTRDEHQLLADRDHLLSDMSTAEIQCLQEIDRQLSRPEAVDSKLDTVKWFLTKFHSDNKTWLEHGCIIFSQYYDTAEWVAKEIAKTLGDEVVAVYAGVGKSGLFRGESYSTVQRDSIKAAVKTREIRLVVATDAACEGLNLQTLGTLINIDLPWNPSRLEQRLGRIKRFGQSRKSVDMLNLVYHETQDERVYNVLSERLKDSYDIFGSLPDTIEDEWIENEETLRERMDEYMHERSNAQNAFSIKYKESVNPNDNKWEYCSEVLSRRDISEKLSKPW